MDAKDDFEHLQMLLLMIENIFYCCECLLIFVEVKRLCFRFLDVVLPGNSPVFWFWTGYNFLSFFIEFSKRYFEKKNRKL